MGDHIFFIVILVTLIVYSVVVPLCGKKATGYSFPDYRQIDEGDDWSRKGLLILLGWFLLFIGLAISQPDAVGQTYLSGSLVAFLAWRVWTLLRGSRCLRCRGIAAVFRDAEFTQTSALNYIKVCHTCKTVVRGTLFEVTAD